MPRDWLNQSDISREFGHNEGTTGYHYLVDSGEVPRLGDRDKPVVEIAERAVRIAMIASGQFGVDVYEATDAVVEALDGEVVEDKGDKDKEK